MNKLLLESGKYLNPAGEVITGDIGIENGKILFCGAKPAGWQPTEIIDCRNSFTTPGFINAHTHAAMTLFRSYADDMALLDWLQRLECGVDLMKQEHYRPQVIRSVVPGLR